MPESPRCEERRADAIGKSSRDLCIATDDVADMIPTLLIIDEIG